MTPGPHGARDRTWLIGLIALALAFGIAYALLIPAGLPYDEPAHWRNVLFYATQHRLPVIGEPGSSYESQMGPVYYAVAGVIPAVTGWTGVGGLLVVRVASVVVGLVALILLTYRIALLVTGSSIKARWAAVLVGLNPGVVAIGATVSNDLAVLALAAAVTYAGCWLLQRPQISLGSAAGLGALLGVAVLTKVVALVLALALVVGLLRARPGPRIWAILAAAGGATLLVSGWWFVRNLSLYGDLTGAKGVLATGTTFGAGWPTVTDLVRLGGQVISYQLAPVEYYRNEVNLPLGLTAMVVLAAVATVALLLWRGWPLRHGHAARRADVWLVLAVPVATFVGYAYFYLATWHVPPRLLGIAAAPAVAILAGVCRPRDRYVLAALVGVQVIGLVWLLIAGAGATSPGL